MQKSKLESSGAKFAKGSAWQVGKHWKSGGRQISLGSCGAGCTRRAAGAVQTSSVRASLAVKREKQISGIRDQSKRCSVKLHSENAPVVAIEDVCRVAESPSCARRYKAVSELRGEQNARTADGGLNEEPVTAVRHREQKRVSVRCCNRDERSQQTRARIVSCRANLKLLK